MFDWLRKPKESIELVIIGEYGLDTHRLWDGMNIKFTAGRFGEPVAELIYKNGKIYYCAIGIYNTGLDESIKTRDRYREMLANTKKKLNL